MLWPTDEKSQLIRKEPDAGKDCRQKEKEKRRMRWLDCITDAMDMNVSKPWVIVKDRGGWSAAHCRPCSCRELDTN